MKRNQKPRIAFIGGFLGSAKTTLVWESARRLMSFGKHVGVITNDQAPDLVDTALLRAHGLNVEEVAGSCFCCNFFGLIDATKAFKPAGGVDVILAEPVGSCTDLAATLLQPLREMFTTDFQHSQLTVLADPVRLEAIVNGDGGDLNEFTSYVYSMQLEEADIIAINKIDALEPDALKKLADRVTASFPHAKIRYLSSRYGIGVDEWLEEILNSEPEALHIANVDYDLYTKGELCLGWYNGDFHLVSESDPVDWESLCRDFLDNIKSVFLNRKRSIGHLKIYLSCEGGYLAANISESRSQPDLRGDINLASRRAMLTINARVVMPPEKLAGVVSAAMRATFGTEVEILEKNVLCKKPGVPEPTFRPRR